MRAQFITAEEISNIMGVSRTKAYQIVRDMNKELRAMGYITIAASILFSISSRSSTDSELTERAKADGR